MTETLAPEPTGLYLGTEWEVDEPGWKGRCDGACPVQGFGTLDGHHWYFRARGDEWHFAIGRQSKRISGYVADEDAVALYVGDYGVMFDAGWMPASVSRALAQFCVEAFRAGMPSGYVEVAMPEAQRALPEGT